MTAESFGVRARRRMGRVLGWLARPRIAVPLGVLVVYAVVGFLLLPALARHYLPKVLQQQLGVAGSVGELRFDPFRLRLEAHGFAMADPDGRPLLGFEGLIVDFELSSIARRAWTFAEVSLQRPRLDLALSDDGVLNLQRVLDALPASQAQPDAAPTPLVLDQVSVDEAWVSYTDLRGAAPITTAIGPMQLRVQEIATLPDHQGPYTLRVALPGDASARWEGQVSLHPLGSTGTVVLEGLRPAAFWDFAAPHVALEPPEGTVDLRLDYQTHQHGDAWQLKAEALRVGIAGLRLVPSGGRTPLLELNEVELADGRFDFGERSLAFGALRLADGRLAARLDSAGDLDWAGLATASGAVPAGGAAEAAGPADAFSIELPKISVDRLAIGFVDESRNAPLAVDVLVDEARTAAKLTVGGPKPRTRLSDTRLRLADFVAASGADREPLAAAASIALDSGAVDLERRRFEAGKVAVEGLRTGVHRLADGSIRELGLIAATDSEQPLPVAAAAEAWRIRLAQAAITGIDATYTDDVSSPPMRYSVRDGSIQVGGVDTASGEPVQVNVELPVAEGGSLEVGGQVAGDASGAELQVRAEGLSLEPLAPLLAGASRLELVSGSVGADAAVVYKSADAQAPELRIAGSLGIDGLRLNEAAGGERLVAWRSMSASGLEFAVAPSNLRIRELRFAEPEAKIVINEDRTTNLTGLFGQPAPEAESAALESSSAAEPQESTGEAPEYAGGESQFPVVVDRVRVDAGLVDFADLSLVLPFVARIESFAGVARGINSLGDGRATLAFGGRVGEFGEADVDGQLALFDLERFIDIQVQFRNVAMQPLSPYTATFAGRAIERGNLDLELEYKVEDGRLAGDNRMVLQDLELGAKVESPGAVDLPLDLAVALLTDADGRIDLAVPVSGNVNDPQFNIGRLVGRAVGNLISGIVTAPFRALGSLLGGKGESAPNAIRFKSGSSELMPREKARLAQIAALLGERPQLAIVAVPGIEPERDGYAVRRLAVRRAHAAELGFGLEPGEDPGPVSYSEPDSQRALEVLLEARDGDGAVERFADDWSSRNAGAEPERVNRALAVVDRGAGDPAFYREIYLDLVRGQPEPTAALEAIGRARAEAVVTDLVGRGLDTARVGIGAPRPLTQAQPAGVLLPLDLVPVGQLEHGDSQRQSP